MAMRRATGAAIRACASSSSTGYLARQFHASSGDSKKIVGVFYKANEYASKNPNFLGCVENALGIRDWLESKGHEYIVTDDKEGPDCELEKHIPDLHVLISTPFHPAYVTAERIKKAKNLQLLLTAGIGSDHIDLQAAAAAGLTVAEVTGSNVVSVAEDELMRILILMRNFVPGYNQVVNGEWNVAGIAYRAYDLEGKTIGTVGAGRIGKLLLQRLKPFGCNLLYHDRLQMEPNLEKEIGAKYVEDLNEMLPKCDVVVVNTPLTEKTRGMFNSEMIGKMKRGVMIVNNARGAIMDRQAVVEAVESGHIGGYSGDVWDPQPAPKDHPWRYMPNQAMTPHISGTTIDAQLRYAAGTKDMLERYFKGEDFPAANYIVKDGELAPQYSFSTQRLTLLPSLDSLVTSSRMASNTLKDMNSLPVIEKISDCKPSLTKPSAGKMNGKSDDRPLPKPGALSPSDHLSVVETEKPDAEIAVVEVEYIESEKLDNVDDADAVLKSVLAGLDSKDWVSVCDALNNVRRLSIFHKEEMLHMLDKVIPLVVKSLKNPRSAVCKTACMTSADIFSAYNNNITDLLDSLLTQLLLKSSQDKRFVCEAAEKALTAMTKYIAPTLLLPKLQPCLKNRNPRIRAKASLCFSRSVPRLGVEGIKEYGIDKLLQAAASQLSDQLPESREAARTVLLELQTVYEKVHPLTKPETQTLSSSSSLPEEEQIPEAEPITWETFCHSKLSALSAQAVLRATNVVTVTAREGLVTKGPSSSSQL
ncbi:unnamed protein product [Microthlaspi erraticum]|uniref:Formate dehydrogenase, mitochondrial n=1 Tax=Microthlaspi erraticum TaxID=1685480 RepID=A0A6D2IXM3_9BRAS|nr:unnamed protein product [Microthlaspi erraticum]